MKSYEHDYTSYTWVTGIHVGLSCIRLAQSLGKKTVQFPLFSGIHIFPLHISVVFLTQFTVKNFIVQVWRPAWNVTPQTRCVCANIICTGKKQLSGDGSILGAAVWRWCLFIYILISLCRYNLGVGCGGNIQYTVSKNMFFLPSSVF